MSEAVEISACAPQDYSQILDDLAEFWDGRDVRSLHHPFLIHEFSNSAFVIRDGSRFAAYLFGFISQTEPVGYVHIIAVRASARGGAWRNASMSTSSSWPGSAAARRSRR